MRAPESEVFLAFGVLFFVQRFGFVVEHFMVWECGLAGFEGSVQQFKPSRLHLRLLYGLVIVRFTRLDVALPKARDDFSGLCN